MKKGWTDKDTLVWAISNWPGQTEGTVAMDVIESLCNPEGADATSVFCWINGERTRRQQAAIKAEREKSLPTRAELVGSCPDLTGELSTKEYMDEIRGREGR